MTQSQEPDPLRLKRPTDSLWRHRAPDIVAFVDFELDDEQRAWVAEVRQFLRRERHP